jgi:hypothetical protein
MSSIFIVIGVMAGAIMGVLADWILKEFLPPNPKLRHLAAGVVACIVLASVVTWAEFWKQGNISSPVILQTPQLGAITPSQIATKTSFPKSSLPTTAPTNQLQPTTTPTETPTPRITSAPQAIDSSNEGVAITIYDLAANDNHNVYFQALAGGDPINNVDFDFYEVTQDIAGNWTQVDRDVWTFSNERTNSDGVIQGTLSPGMYAIEPDWWDTRIFGTWGIESASGEVIVFPVFPGRRTEIVLSLAIIEIGVLSPDGEALRNKRVYVECQGVDIAGNIISDDRCDDHNWAYFTDQTGLGKFVVGAGTYIVGINYNNYGRRYTYLSDVTVSPGEVRREILIYDYPGD